MLKALEVPPAVFIQIGSVEQAREAVRDGADVLVCQGIDAGGHQLRKNIGVVSLLPCVKSMLQDEFPDRDITLIGAGGIVTGDGLAAVAALGKFCCASCQVCGICEGSADDVHEGAAGAVLGTRVSAYPVSVEIWYAGSTILTKVVQFTVAHESTFADHRKQLVIATKDGGAETMKYVFCPSSSSESILTRCQKGRLSMMRS